MVKKIKMRFPVVAVLLLLGSLVIGGIAGAFLYATGERVVLTPIMQMVSHTEYRYGEAGQIIARLVDFQGNPVVVTNCTTTILYPDKSIFVNAQLMTESANITGDYYYDFTTPVAGPEGVYEYQATCYYSGGTKNASVTNSFHLSSALTTIEQGITDVQGNLTELSSQVSAVNASLAQDISDLSSQLDANISTLYAQADNNLATVQAQLNANTTTVLNALTDVNSSLYAAIQNIQLNLTPVLDALDALNVSIVSEFAALSADMSGNFSVVTGNQATILSNQADIIAALGEVNATTVSTYQYVTGTLTTKVDQVLTDLGIVNETVNRIETVTNTINSTTTQILENQQNEVRMDVFSG